MNFRFSLTVLILAVASVVSADAAFADMRVENRSDNTVSLAAVTLHSNDGDTIRTNGWYTLKPGESAVVVRGPVDPSVRVWVIANVRGKGTFFSPFSDANAIGQATSAHAAPVRHGARFKNAYVAARIRQGNWQAFTTHVSGTRSYAAWKFQFKKKIENYTARLTGRMFRNPPPAVQWSAVTGQDRTQYRYQGTIVQERAANGTWRQLGGRVPDGIKKLVTSGRSVFVLTNNGIVIQNDRQSSNHAWRMTNHPGVAVDVWVGSDSMLYGRKAGGYRGRYVGNGRWTGA